MKKPPCRQFPDRPVLFALKRIFLLSFLLLLIGRPLKVRAVFLPEQLNEKYYINIILILDCSASMNKIIGPVRKIDIAKKTVETIVSDIAGYSHDVGSIKVGLRVFGSKFFKWKKNCDDTSMEIPLAEIEKTKIPILAKVNGIMAKGQSALSITMEELRQDFPDDDEQSNFIVVISDGDESCGGDPCAQTKKLVDNSKGVSVSTLGVETDKAGLDNLNCMAEAGNGRYFDYKQVDDFVLFLKDCNQTIQENRRTLALLGGNKRDSTLIALQDITQNMTEYRIESPLPLYSWYNEASPVDDTVRPSDKLFIIETRGLWKQILFQDKQKTGWILVKKGGAENMLTVAFDNVPLLRDKDLASAKLTTLNAGDQLTILKKEGRWYNVFYQKINQQGWVVENNVVGN